MESGESLCCSLARYKLRFSTNNFFLNSSASSMTSWITEHWISSEPFKLATWFKITSSPTTQKHKCQICRGDIILNRKNEKKSKPHMKITGFSLTFDDWQNLKQFYNSTFLLLPNWPRKEPEVYVNFLHKVYNHNTSLRQFTVTLQWRLAIQSDYINGWSEEILSLESYIRKMRLGYRHGVHIIYPSGNGGWQCLALTYNYYKTVK